MLVKYIIVYIPFFLFLFLPSYCLVGLVIILRKNDVFYLFKIMVKLLCLVIFLLLLIS